MGEVQDTEIQKHHSQAQPYRQAPPPSTKAQAPTNCTWMAARRCASAACSQFHPRRSSTITTCNHEHALLLIVQGAGRLANRAICQNSKRRSLSQRQPCTTTDAHQHGIGPLKNRSRALLQVFGGHAFMHEPVAALQLQHGPQHIRLLRHVFGGECLHCVRREGQQRSASAK